MKAFNEGQKRKKVCRSNDLVKAYQSQTTLKKKWTQTLTLSPIKKGFALLSLLSHRFNRDLKIPGRGATTGTAL